MDENCNLVIKGARASQNFEAKSWDPTTCQQHTISERETLTNKAGENQDHAFFIQPALRVLGLLLADGVPTWVRLFGAKRAEPD